MRKGIPVSARLPTMRAVVVNGMALNRPLKGRGQYNSKGLRGINHYT